MTRETHPAESDDTVVELTERRLLDLVDGARAELVGLCAAMVAAPSVNPPGDTRAVAAVVADYLRAHGADPELVAVDPLMPSVVAEARGREAGAHLVLNGHLDTMEPGDESLWTVPRYELTARDGRLYGLGMGNMIGAVAGLALTFRLLAADPGSWPGRLTFTAVSDECVFGDNGAAHLLGSRPEQVLGDALICGEGPGMQRLALAEKGVAWYEVVATADGGHSSRAREGGTASVRLAHALVALDNLNSTSATAPAGLDGLAPDDVEALRLSANAGTLAGGTFISQIATTATARIDVRVPPGISLSDLEADMDRRLAACDGVTWRRLKGWEANWSGLDVPFVAAFAQAAGDVRRTPPVVTVRLPASDASRWRARGVPAVCYGPQPTLSAGIDDYAEEQDVVDCAKTYAVAALRYLRSGGGTSNMVSR